MIGAASPHLVHGNEWVDPGFPLGSWPIVLLVITISHVAPLAFCAAPEQASEAESWGLYPQRCCD